MPPETTIEEQLPTSEDQAAESTEGSGKEGSSDGSGSTNGGSDGS